MWCNEPIYRQASAVPLPHGHTTPARPRCGRGSLSPRTVGAGRARPEPCPGGARWGLLAGDQCGELGEPLKPPGAAKGAGAAPCREVPAGVPEGRARPAHRPALPAAGSARGRRGRGAAAGPRLPAAGRQRRRSRSAPAAAPQLSGKHCPLVLVPPPAAGKRRAAAPGRAGGGRQGAPVSPTGGHRRAPRRAHGRGKLRPAGGAGAIPECRGDWGGKTGRSGGTGTGGQVPPSAERSGAVRVAPGAVRGRRRRRRVSDGRRTGAGGPGLRAESGGPAVPGAERAGPGAGQRGPGGGAPGGGFWFGRFALRRRRGGKTSC